MGGRRGGREGNGREKGGMGGEWEGGSWPLPLSPVECLDGIGGGRTKTICPEGLWQHSLMTANRDDGDEGDGTHGDGGGCAGRGGDDGHGGEDEQGRHDGSHRGVGQLEDEEEQQGRREYGR